jgi:hypothetical protein
MTRALLDQHSYAKGSFLAYAQPWSTFPGGRCASLKRGTDYLDTITVNEATFPAGSTIRHFWPMQAAGAPPCGYNFITWGKYDGTDPAVPVPTRLMSDVSTLAIAIDLSWAALAGDFNLLVECFAFADKAGTQKVAEIGFFPHAPAATAAYVKAGRRVGIFTDASGIAWLCGVQPGPAGPYYMFVTANGTDVPKGRIAMGAAIAWLIANGELTGREWFTGLALGTEPLGGSAIVFVNALSVDAR